MAGRWIFVGSGLAALTSAVLLTVSVIGEIDALATLAASGLAASLAMLGVWLLVSDPDQGRRDPRTDTVLAWRRSGPESEPSKRYKAG